MLELFDASQVGAGRPLLVAPHLARHTIRTPTHLLRTIPPTGFEQLALIGRRLSITFSHTGGSASSLLAGERAAVAQFKGGQPSDESQTLCPTTNT